MQKNIIIAIFLPILALSSLFSAPSTVVAGAVTQTEFCNVTVTFKATVPNSVEEGQNFTVTGISVQPAKSYRFNVSSSVFEMTATNTSSPNYSQNFAYTNPSPTTGHSTYVGHYPNWSHTASGNAGGNVVIKLKKSTTVVQGYGNVVCNFSKTLATIPITAATPDPPDPDPSPSPSPSPSTSPSPTPDDGGGSSGGGGTGSGGTGSSGGSKKPGSKSDDKKDTSKDSKNEDQPKDIVVDDNGEVVNGDELSVVPLAILVRDENGKIVPNAEVTLDGGEKQKTDENGRVVFSNVLTGGHSISVSYQGRTISKDLDLSTENFGEVVEVKLPGAMFTFSPAFIAIAGAGLAVIGGIIGLWLFRRHQRRAAIEDAVFDVPSRHLTYLPGVMSGSVIESSSGNYTMLTPTQPSQPTAQNNTSLTTQPGVPPPMAQQLPPQTTAPSAPNPVAATAPNNQAPKTPNVTQQVARPTTATPQVNPVQQATAATQQRVPVAPTPPAAQVQSGPPQISQVRSAVASQPFKKVIMPSSSGAPAQPIQQNVPTQSVNQFSRPQQLPH